ncbi:hypothetical protein FBR01_05955 [Anaerolineae bacterium CFX8]|nr:hypothetical protein [Anaerolineae bacterium CFX8]
MAGESFVENPVFDASLKSFSNINTPDDLAQAKQYVRFYYSPIRRRILYACLPFSARGQLPEPPSNTFGYIS